MRKAFAAMAALALLCLGISAQADVFNLGPGLTNLETVPVGDPGNTGELSGGRICGAVDHGYRIATYEVTAAQYTDFLNNKAKTDPYGLYNELMSASTTYGCGIERSGSGTLEDPYSYSVANDEEHGYWANRPVNYVSFWDSCRFANWLNNGQGTGDTETGTYTLNDYNGDDGSWILRNLGATWFLTSEDEWYKAAYYKGGTDAGYWGYPTQNNAMPDNQLIDPDPGNNSNSRPIDGEFTIGPPYYRTPVGEFENSESAYVTFDQGGNVWEWNERLVAGGPGDRCLRGGSFIENAGYQHTAYPISYWPTLEVQHFGFRVGEVIPEPSSMLALLAGLGGLGTLVRRRKK